MNILLQIQSGEGVTKLPLWKKGAPTEKAFSVTICFLANRPLFLCCAAKWLEVEHGQGFVAVGQQGGVIYLDNQGDTALNGVRLAHDIEEFWSTWRQLAFVALDAVVLEEIRTQGFGRETSFARAVTERLSR